jgi:nucleoside-triphosphatase THEP1
MITRSIVLVTGDSGSGKTQFCASVINAIQREDLHKATIRGILSPALIRHDEKLGIQAANVETSEHKNLAELNDGEPGTTSTKRWRFDPKVLAWCNAILSNATPCDVLVLDEIGPLEFERGEGFTIGLEAIDSGEYKLALVVVRPHLLDAALERWPEAEILNVEALENKKKAIDEIIRRLDAL